MLFKEPYSSHSPNKKLAAILKLQSMLRTIKREIQDEWDDSACEWSAHISDVLEQLQSGQMSLEDAESSLGMKLQ